MTDAHWANRLALSSGELKYQRTLVYCPGLEDGEGTTDESVCPIGKGEARRGSWDSDMAQSVVERASREQ